MQLRKRHHRSLWDNVALLLLITDVRDNKVFILNYYYYTVRRNCIITAYGQDYILFSKRVNWLMPKHNTIIIIIIIVMSNYLIIINMYTLKSVTYISARNYRKTLFSRIYTYVRWSFLYFLYFSSWANNFTIIIITLTARNLSPCSIFN